MASRVGIFPSYDFFGKTIPGIVLIIGTLAMSPRLPQIQFYDLTRGASFESLAVVATSFIVVGFITGEIVNTIAVNQERLTYWLGKRIFGLSLYMHSLTPPILYKNRFIKVLNKRPRIKRIYEIIKIWMARRVWGVHDLFAGHRLLFQNQLGRHFDPNSDRRNSGEKNFVYYGFWNEVKNRYDLSPNQSLTELNESQDNYRIFGQIYPLAVSEISEKEDSRANRFHSRYSFCHAMWVVLMILLVMYTWSLYESITINGHTPFIVTILETPYGTVIYVVLIGSIVIFMKAMGEYKRYYVEYLIVEYFHIINRRNNDE